MRATGVMAILVAAAMYSYAMAEDGTNQQLQPVGDDFFNRFVPPDKPFGDAVGLQAPFTQYTKLVDGGAWIKDLGIKWMREDMNTGPVNPEPAVYDFDAGPKPTMHERFQFYADNKINVIVVVYGRNKKVYPNEPGGHYPVEAYGDYALAVAKQLETYGFDFVLELMNEPHGRMQKAFGGNSQGGSPDGGVAPWMKRYVAMANNAIQKVKAHNPKIELITDDDLWIAHYWMVQGGIDKRLDGFAIHPYHKPYPGKGNDYHSPYWKMINGDQSRRSNIQRVRHVYESTLGHSVVPYSTEVGFSDMTVGGGGAHDKQRPEVIAAYLPREFIIEFAAGVEVIQWFALKHPSRKFGDPFGLVSMKGHHKRKSYFALRTMVQQLGDYRMIDQVAGRANTVAGTQAYLFRNELNEHKVVIWDIMDDSKDVNDTKPLKIALDTANVDGVRLCDIYGKELNKTFDSEGCLQLGVGIAPVYIAGVGRYTKLKNTGVPLRKVLIDDFSADKWGFSNGGEYPGAKGGKILSAEEHVSAPTAMCIEYDFTGGGNYVGISRGIPVSEQVKSISFRAKITGKNRIFMRIVDSSGQNHATNPISLNSIGEWTGVTVDLSKSKFPLHWQGAKDGVIHWPLKSIFIGPNRAKNKKGEFYIDDLEFLVQGEWQAVTFPDYDLSTQDARLIGRSTPAGYSFTLSNTSDRDLTAVVELLDAPNGYTSLALPWRKGKGQEDVLNSAGPGSKFTHLRKLTVPAGKTVACSFPIDCPNWNPYNRYPLTCRLTVGDQVSTQEREILGAKSKGVLLGQPRNSKDITESSIGVVYPWEHGALKKCLPMIAEAGIKWNRGSVRYVKVEETKLGRKPVGLQPSAIKYLEDLKANGINLIESDYIGRYETAEAAYTYFKGLAEVLKPYGVDHFEIGNEPNGHMPGKWGGNWNGVTDDQKIAPWIYKFVEFVNAAAKGIKEVHPEAVVIAGAGLNTTAHRAIQVGLSKDVDGVSDHPYPYSITPELVPWGGEHVTKRDGYKSADDDHTFISHMRLLKEEAIRAGRPDLQIWLTEWGIPTHQYEGQQRFSKEQLEEMDFNVIEMGKQNVSIYEGHTLKTQAKYLARRLIETLSIPDIVTKNFYFCFNRGPWFNKRHWEMGGFSVTRTQDGSPKPSFYAMQRICGLFSDGVKPVEEAFDIQVPLDRKQGRTGLAWKRPYAAEPVLWEGKVPMHQLTTPRKHAFVTPQGELMIVVWMPVRAEDWREPDFCDVVLGITGYGHPIAIDILTGERTDLEWEEDAGNGVTILKAVTVPDYPIVIKLFSDGSGLAR